MPCFLVTWFRCSFRSSKPCCKFQFVSAYLKSKGTMKKDHPLMTELVSIKFLSNKQSWHSQFAHVESDTQLHATHNRDRKERRSQNEESFGDRPRKLGTYHKTIAVAKCIEKVGKTTGHSSHSCHAKHWSESRQLANRRRANSQKTEILNFI